MKIDQDPCGERVNARARELFNRDYPDRVWLLQVVRQDAPLKSVATAKERTNYKVFARFSLDLELTEEGVV